ncbi:MAG: aminoacyl-histidine dipeptidase [Lachnospiraceae bacterium]|nr:aminoacyl-histidine dipeptidase [Lachnospiraceae bacterium]
MGKKLAGLQPERVFHYFEEICSIPHPSYREERISNYLTTFAKEHGLEYYQDELHNVIIIKEATDGYEAAEPLILQGHMDMVCEKDADCSIDFEQDGLDLYVDGDFVTARGTTLGGDDGIAIAYALAILESGELAHPRLEFVCTVCEEVGMEGATGIDVSMLKGKRLLNLDSEEEGIFLAGCAGGCTAECVLPVTRETVKQTVMEIRVKVLLGGHSGTEIDKGRANANQLLARILMELLAKTGVQLISFEGGSKDNAIPREARLVAAVTDEESIYRILEELNAAIAREYRASDPGIQIEGISNGTENRQVLTRECTRTVASLLNALPNGIQTMSMDIPGLVETSLNLGILKLEQEELHLHYSVRSSIGSDGEYVMHKLKLITEQLGGSVSFRGRYPAWEYRKDSAFREELVRIYAEMFGTEPKVETIHAGVECGILAQKIEGLDCVSMGPDIFDIHTTSERLSISSTKRMWEYLQNIVKKTP